MSKRKDPADAFGLSLMDVLSNALGGVILLVMIVAVTLKGNDRLRKNKPEEERQGMDYTALEYKRSKVIPKWELNLLTVQIRFVGKASLDADCTTGCSLARSGNDTLSTDWLFTAEIDSLPPKTVLKLEDRGGTLSNKDSVSVIASREMAILGSRIVPYDPTQADRFLVITRVDRSVELSLQGKRLP